MAAMKTTPRLGRFYFGLNTVKLLLLCGALSG
jgi:hypothetical protein